MSGCMTCEGGRSDKYATLCASCMEALDRAANDGTVDLTQLSIMAWAVRRARRFDRKRMGRPVPPAPSAETEGEGRG